MTLITFHMLSTGEHLMVYLQNRVILGRTSGLESDGTLNIDLSSFIAYQLGVSRRHVLFILDMDDILAFDLASQKGSYLNGKEMCPRKGYLIHDSDEIMLGTLAMRVYITSEVPYCQHLNASTLSLESPVQNNSSMAMPKPDIRKTLVGSHPLEKRTRVDAYNWED